MLNICIFDIINDIFSNIFIKNNNMGSKKGNINVNNDNGNITNDINEEKNIFNIIDKKLIL